MGKMTLRERLAELKKRPKMVAVGYAAPWSSGSRFLQSLFAPALSSYS